MDYEEKYLKYKKKYIELKSQKKMKGGVNPEYFIEKNIQPQKPILLNFREIGNTSREKLKSLFMQDLDRCIEIVNHKNGKLSGGGIEKIINDIRRKKLTEEESTKFNDLVTQFNGIENSSLIKEFGKLLNDINSRVKKSTLEKVEKVGKVPEKVGQVPKKVITPPEPKSDDNIYYKLKYIIQYVQNITLTISFSLLKLTSEPIYLININGNNDKILIKLGKQYNFPRGFPVIWIPNTLLKIYGFYPKFDNDDKRGDDAIKTESEIELEKVVKMTMFKKWSGYLGQLCVFSYNGKDYWTVTSKKSSTNVFSHDGIRLFKEFITSELIDFLIARNLHICAEMLSLNDQSHGYQLKKESPIVTMIAEGNQCDILNKKLKGNIKQFISPYQISEIVSICNRFNLPCDTGIIIEGNSNIMQFIKSLEKNRDFITDTIFESIIKNEDGTPKIDGITFKHGTVSHSTIVGDALEGLVLRLEYDNTQSNRNKKRPSTIKYKFPIYTIRTMLIRILFSEASKDNIDFIEYIEKPSSKNKIEQYIRGWVGPSGRPYWRLYVDKCIEIYKTSEFKKKLLHYKNCHNLTNMAESDIKCIGPHILLADEVLNKIGYPSIISGVSSIEPIEPIKQIVPTPLIIGFFGSVGSGKSTTMNKFCEYANDFYQGKFIPIDGDSMDLEGLDAMNFLGGEKNDYLNYLIIRQIIFGNVPVVSHGSFVFTQICDYVQKIIGIKPKLLLCEMIHNSNGNGNGNYEEDGEDDGGGGGSKEDDGGGGGSKEDDGGGGGSKEGNSDIKVKKLTQFISWNSSIYKQAAKAALVQRYEQSIKEFDEGKEITGWLFPNEKDYADKKKQEKEIDRLIEILFRSNQKSDPISKLNENDDIEKYGCDLVNHLSDIDFTVLFDDVETYIKNVREIKGEVKFNQLRYLVKYWKGDVERQNVKDSASFGHITLDYDMKNGLTLNPDIISNSENFNIIKQYPLVTAKYRDAKQSKEISAIVCGKITEEVENYEGVKYLNFKGTEDNPKYVHITVKNGVHLPFLMSKFSQFYINGERNVVMEYKDKNKLRSEINYVYQHPSEYNVKYYKPYYV